MSGAGLDRGDGAVGGGDERVGDRRGDALGVAEEVEAEEAEDPGDYCKCREVSDEAGEEEDC